jgi:hypothetical protein
MTNEFKNFYFLHIRKTGGRYFKEYILKQLEDKVEKLPIKDRHEGWKKEIDDNTYVFSILRDPVEYICSVYAHMISTRAGLLHPSNENGKHTDSIKDNIVNIELDKKYMFEWIRYNKWTHNLQSKEILHTSEEYNNILNIIIKKYSKDNNVDKELLYERLNRINLLVRQVSLKNPESIVKKLCDDLNIELAGEIQKDTLTYHNMASTNLYNSLTEEDKIEIRQMFDIDNEIYNNHSIFSQLDNVCSFCGEYSYTTKFDSSWKKYSYCSNCIESGKALLG